MWRPTIRRPYGEFVQFDGVLVPTMDTLQAVLSESVDTGSIGAQDILETNGGLRFVSATMAEL